MYRKIRLAAAAALLVALIGAQITTAAVPTDSTGLRDAVTVDGIREHQQALQDIADANGGTRHSGSSGFDESADYVAEKLEDAGYSVTRQPFDFPFFQELASAELERISPDPRVYDNAEDNYPAGDFLTMSYSGSGSPTALLQEVNDLVLPPGPTASSSNAGCEDADFASAVFTGTIALIQRGTCTFAEKALNAQEAGAVGVLIFNEGQPGRQEALAGTLGGPDFTIPVMGTSFAVGDELATLLDNGPVTIRMFTSTLSEIRSTENIIAETSGGRSDRVVVVGAHLDSVTEGPGINDNGSGSATILEIAEQIDELGITPRNKIRFMWYGAEEAGLLGSEHYVSLLSTRQIKDIAVMLNFDMVGSPNFVRFVYDGDGSGTGTVGPNGSDVVEDVFLDYFGDQGLASEPTAFDGRSDYGPFIAVGIPAGGLFTGAEGIKTPAQVAIYGGTAGLAYDPCYHQACDTFDNNNSTVLGQFGDAAAHATLSFAMTTSAVNGAAKASSHALDANLKSMLFKGSQLQR